MRSRINSTSRKDIDSALTAFTVVERSDGTAEFQATLNLGGLKLPADGQVVVEAYRQSLHERFSFGTVGKTAAAEPTALRELGKDNIRFRVKVVEPSTGRLLARADKLAPDQEAEAGRRELLKVIFRDLGQEPWKTAIVDEGPVLIVNRNIPDAQMRVRADPQFQALILPGALRQVLLMLWLQKAEEDDADEAEGHWTTDWIRYATQISGKDKPNWEDEVEVTEWIDDICQAFSTTFGILNKLAAEA